MTLAASTAPPLEHSAPPATEYDWGKLREPFKPDDIEWRIARSGLTKDKKPWAQVLAYITNRAVMERLDDVFGPANWRNEYVTGPTGGLLCGLSVRIGDEWVTKWDGAEETALEKVKGGLSAAMKRAAVQWGIGRYLYDLPDGWAQISDKGKHFATHDPRNEKKERTQYKWDPPQLPAWAQPKTKPEAVKDEPKPVKKSKRKKPELDAWVKEYVTGYGTALDKATVSKLDKVVLEKKGELSAEQLARLRTAREQVVAELEGKEPGCDHKGTEREPTDDGKTACAECGEVLEP